MVLRNRVPGDAVEPWPGDPGAAGKGAVGGDEAGHEDYWAFVYQELRRVARRQLRKNRDTLQATALVHEAYLRLADDAQVMSRGRAYFFASASRAMRQILVDHARSRSRAKRGGGEAPITLKTGDAEVEGLGIDLLDLHQALNELERLSRRQVRVVECRYFSGLGVEETAKALDSSPRTVKRDWQLARAWLFRRLEAAQDG